MTMRDPKSGLPILGATNPEQEFERRKQAYLNALAREKAGLQADDHDWVVFLAYALTEVDAERAAIAKITGIAANPSIPVLPETMRDDTMPVCIKCQQHYPIVQAMPCPGMPFEEYLASLDEDTRAQVIARLTGQAVPEPEAPTAPTAPADATIATIQGNLDALATDGMVTSE